MLEVEALHASFRERLRGQSEELPGIPRDTPGVTGVAMHQDVNEAGLTVFGLYPYRFLRARDEQWDKLQERGMRYEVSGPILAAVRGGDSIGSKAGVAGTMGCVVSDQHSGREFILSCHHVLADLAGAKPGDDVIHPAIPPGTGKRIAGYERSGPIGFNSTDVNLVDAALARPNVPLAKDIHSVGAIRGVCGDPDFNALVQKHGQTTGHTIGTVQYKSLTFRNLYYDGTSPLFEGQFGVVGDGSAPLFGDRGDSGALVVTMSGEAVGMVIAVATGIDLTLVTPIEVVQNELGVSLST